MYVNMKTPLSRHRTVFQDTATRDDAVYLNSLDFVDNAHLVCPALRALVVECAYHYSVHTNLHTQQEV